MPNQHDVFNACTQDTMLELARNSFTTQHASDRSMYLLGGGFRMIEQAPHALGTFLLNHVNRLTYSSS